MCTSNALARRIIQPATGHATFPSLYQMRMTEIEDNRNAPSPTFARRTGRTPTLNITQRNVLTAVCTSYANQRLYKVALSRFDPKDGNVRTRDSSKATCRSQSFGPLIHE